MWGKVLGLLFGFMFGGWFGALFGLWLGHRFDKGLARQFDARGGFSGLFGSGDSSRRATFFHATFAVMGHLAKASGRVSEAEIQFASSMMARLELEGDARREAQAAFREGKMAAFPLQSTLRDFRQTVSGRRDILQFFLEVQLQAAFADGQLHPSEREILMVIAKELGFSGVELNRLINMMEAFLRQGGGAGTGGQGEYSQQSQRPAPSRQMSFEDACEIIGIDAGASPVEIKRAYRRQMAQHHPDKLESRGLPPEMKQLALEKSQQIQAAYKVVKARRGFR